MQEFFAARHLTNWSATELRNFITENIKESKWLLVFPFLAGLMVDKNDLPSEIISNLLAVKTEEKQSADYNEQWTENEEKRKVTLCPTKDEQDLAGNNILVIGAQHLAKAINKNNRQLRMLNLSLNNISDIRAQHLTKVFNNNVSQLHTLNLLYNDTSDTGAQHLAEAIKNNNCQLHTLNLWNNNIADNGAQNLAEAITNNNCQLCTLDLAANENTTEAGKQKAYNLLSNNQSKCEMIILRNY
ncbi:unnamed protein product, partial [Pocillopora meandrina]